MARFDSTKTRVTPVFNILRGRTDQWIRRLLGLLCDGRNGEDLGTGLDLSFQQGFWGTEERGLAPPSTLLTWLVTHPEHWNHCPDSRLRQKLFDRDSTTVDLALSLLSRKKAAHEWYVLEGNTFPDVFLQTPGAIVVIEGKRTENGPTVDTKWMKGRHQMWRHIDAAWEMRKGKRVFGFFVVEDINGRLPERWRVASRKTVDSDTLNSSLPHRSDEVKDQLKRCFLGATTWGAICGEFGISKRSLPNVVET